MLYEEVFVLFLFLWLILCLFVRLLFTFYLSLRRLLLVELHLLVCEHQQCSTAKPPALRGSRLLRQSAVRPQTCQVRDTRVLR